MKGGDVKPTDGKVEESWDGSHGRRAGAGKASSKKSDGCDGSVGKNGRREEIQ